LLKIIFVSNKIQSFLNWCFLSNFFFITTYFKFFFLFYNFKNNFKFLKFFNSDKNVIIKQIKNIKKRLCYFLFLSGTQKNLHYSYNSLIYRKFLKPKTVYFLNFSFLLNQLTILLNLFSNLLLKNYLFFIFNFDFLINDIYSFSKYIFSVKDVLKYKFIFDYDVKKFRNFKWKSRFNFFVKRKKVKIAFLLDVYNDFFFIDYLKTLKIVTVGLIPLNVTHVKLDFWFITNINSYLVKYLFFSYIYSIYNIILSQKMFRFFYVYNKNTQKYLNSIK